VKSSPLKAWRKRSGLQAADVARRTGLSAVSVWRVESGVQASVPGAILRLVAAEDGPEVAADLQRAHTAWRRELAAEPIVAAK